MPGLAVPQKFDFALKLKSRQVLGLIECAQTTTKDLQKLTLPCWSASSVRPPSHRLCLASHQSSLPVVCGGTEGVGLGLERGQCQDWKVTMQALLFLQVELWSGEVTSQLGYGSGGGRGGGLTSSFSSLQNHGKTRSPRRSG